MRSRRLLDRLIIAAVGVALCVSAARAQQASPIARLAPPDLTFAEEFTVIASARELSNGRILVTDEKEERIVVLDPRSGTSVDIGRKGAGPGEYRQVGRAWPLAGDSSIVKEPYAPRWLILSAERVIATLGPGDASVLKVGPYRLVGADALGHVLWAQHARDAAGRPQIADSLLLLRLHRGTQRIDTISRLQSEEGWTSGAGAASNAPPVAASSGGAPERRRYVISLSAPDEVAVYADGWVAIARASPYRVDWCPPREGCRRGVPLAVSSLPMTDREKRAYLAVAAATHSWPPTTALDETTGWPNVVPPFATPAARLDGAAVVPMADGRLLVERLPSAAIPKRRYDMISRAGVRVGTLEVELVERIVGTSAKHVYVAVTDADGVQRLRRHPVP